ncbi:DNA-binding protein [Prauserella cavernicola]|uniref:LytTR family transcriptional regulator DNA-binding domain-containing protein n=1 Tax=Prauserella cavernicola TaxID=2800127 RepID=A0A934V893_9PSEU|nr:DNA-binding protein [Prauserella cavernicola]MBK1789417.1 LytTR family transcriptional regulator DNA-binding domain-containing protein [Prauserella cavernicola]
MTGKVPPLAIAPSRPTGRGHVADGSLVATSSAREVARAWENFAAGDDVEAGVRPEILASWYRCRDRYEVDRTLNVAPGARGDDTQLIDNGVIFTALGGLGALAGREVERDGAVVTVTDGDGRVLGSWGDPSAQRRAELHNLAPWSSWSEECTGTNGMGTSLEMSGPVTVTGPEHWCEAFHQWACAGISIRDVVTGSPVASINISRWNASLSEFVSPWLTKAVACVEQEIYRRAIYEADKVISEFNKKNSQVHGPFMAMDRGGNVIAANAAAVTLLGLADEAPIVAGAIEPAERWISDISGLPDVVRWAKDRAQGNAQWSGYASLPVCPGEDATSLTLRPVVVSNHVVGMLCSFGVQEGEPYESNPDELAGALPRRVIGMRNDRLVLLAPSEIRYAEADRNIVWLITERGRIQAANRGLDNVERLLTPFGFRRVHRRFLVNLRRVAELERGIKGELFLIMDSRSHEFVPVSRRHAPELRRMLGV